MFSTNVDVDWMQKFKKHSEKIGIMTKFDSVY